MHPSFRNAGKASFRTRGKAGAEQLPKPLIAGIDPARWGHVAEWLRSGLQSRVVSQFDQRDFRNSIRNCLKKSVGFAAKISISEIRLPDRSLPDPSSC
jgi:hypothetical protein